ncbi:MAG: carboxypeptidase M32 [bacterium]|nr:carboxypeptidase M32 [bacterium]
MATAYDALVSHHREVFLLGSTSALLGWDQETYMPTGAGEVRAEQLALLARLQHERATDPRIGDWLDDCEAGAERASHGEDDAAERAAIVRELRRDFDRATKLPPALVGELAEVESRAQQAWAGARTDSDFAGFAPWLERMVGLQQQKADCLAETGASRWDALADCYEPGMRAADLERVFSPLRERLVALRERLAGGRAPNHAFVRAKFPIPAQERFVNAVVRAMGFDFERGRIDRSTHPFCTGTGADVRLTTRFHEDNVVDALGSTMHEGGHGLYEQGLPVARLGTPLGEAVSLGIHESQSRLFENHVGRSRAFWEWVWPQAREQLGAGADGFAAAQAFRDANLVQPSLIRVEADEATYDLHVMVRFEIERELIAGDLPVADLPARWNGLYRDYLGVEVPDDRRGCLQDVHWSCGLFGYFPTYTLGNLYAAQFAAAADRALGGLDRLIGRGDFAPLVDWLRDNVHRHGRRYSPAELCQRATGAPLSSEPFFTYLEAKLTDAYEL